MIVQIIKPFFKWKPGDQPDVTEEMAAELVSGGLAFVHEDQTRRDYKPKQPEERQPITVNNNYYLPPEFYGLEEEE